MDKKFIVLIIIVSGAAGAALVYRYGTRIEEKIVTQDRIITHEHTVIAPNGNTVTDKDVVENRRIQDDIKKTISATQTQWRINGGISTGLTLVPFYELGVDRRILGPIWLGLKGSSRGEIGLQVGIEF